MNELTRLRIGNTDILLEELGDNQGKVTISNTEGHNYSMFWGAMGMSLKKFILHINSDYFTTKLLGTTSMEVFDLKRTISQLRNFIRQELNLPWYKHVEFQKHMREVLNEFEKCIDDDRHFVDSFYSSFVNRLNFYMIEDKFDMKDIENEFKNISEPWHFIVKKESKESKWLKSLHVNLKNELTKK